MPEPLMLRVFAVPGRVVFAPDSKRLRRLGCDTAGNPLPEGELIPAVQTNAGIVPQSAMYRASILAGDLATASPVEAKPDEAKPDEAQNAASAQAEVAPTESTEAAQ